MGYCVAVLMCMTMQLTETCAHTHIDTSHRYVPDSVGNSCPGQRAVRNVVLLLQHNESRLGPSSQQLEGGCVGYVPLVHMWRFGFSPCLSGFRLPSLGP